METNFEHKITVAATRPMLYTTVQRRSRDYFSLAMIKLGCYYPAIQINNKNTSMNLAKISSGKAVPNQCNVVIEIQANSGPIKYEFDKDAGAIVVDRIMPTSMSYPCNYGFIPATLSGDGDPVDVLVHTNTPIMAGAIISVRPIAVLLTEDESGTDEKILAVPDEKTDPFFKNVMEIEDLPEVISLKIRHFFEHYKNLEIGKWVKVSGWKDSQYAKDVILKAITRFNQEN